MGSIYPGKWVFDGEIHRTPEINEVAQLIFHINRKLGHKKTGVKSLENFYSGEVHSFDLNSKKFIDDLRKIARINELVVQEPISRDFTLKYKRTCKKKK